MSVSGQKPGKYDYYWNCHSRGRSLSREEAERYLKDELIEVVGRTASTTEEYGNLGVHSFRKFFAFRSRFMVNISINISILLLSVLVKHLQLTTLKIEACRRRM